MEANDKMERLLDMQEQPERFTDEALSQMLADPEARAWMEATAQGKRAMLRGESPATVGDEDVEMAWRQFEQQHLAPRQPRRSWLQVAATIVGVLLVSGIAFAAVQWRLSARVSEEKAQPADTLTVPVERTAVTAVTPTVAADSVSNVVFDNVALDSILSQVASHYGYTVDYHSEQSRHLRFFLTWNPQEPVEKVVGKLNLFEHLHVVVKDKQIIVE